MIFAAALVALVVEWIAGYPRLLQRFIGHPVQWMGKIVHWSDTSVNSPDESAMTRKAAGVLTVVLLVGSVFLVTGIVNLFLSNIPFGWVIEGLLAASLLAGRQLRDAVSAVASGLEVSLFEGRAAVAEIVGRDTASLDESGVAGAAIETLAENASDGWVAPLFYMLLLGLPGIAVYKAINTADSMIGHRDERYIDFGWAAAKLDDLANWIPARLTALLLAVAGRFTPGTKSVGIWRTARADARKHASPNAGWPEAAMAGALGVALGGPRAYGGRVVDLPYLGDGRRDLEVSDIHLALKLYKRMMIIGTILIVAGAIAAVIVFLA